MRHPLLWVSVLVLAACQPSQPESSAPAAQPNAAVLDWESADIVLPIDAYGMSRAQIHRVEAAASIEFARCATGQVSEGVIAEARRAIEPMRPDPWAKHWLYGFWNADYIAQYGWRPFPEGPEVPEWVAASESTVAACMQLESLQVLVPLHSGMGDAASALLMEVDGQSQERAAQTEEYRELLTQRESCIVDQGYQIDPDSDLRGVDFPSEDEEDMLRAALVEARCSDSLGVTQRLGDLVAGIQNELIRERQAELLSVKQDADARLARANEVLAEAGIG